MKHKFILLVLFAAVVFFRGNLRAEDKAFFSFNIGEKFKITERHNLRKRENGRYIGYTYNEVRGILSAVGWDDGYREYEGRFYVFEETKTDARLIARRIDNVLPGEIDINELGHFKIPIDQNYPLLRDFPVFSKEGISEGERWQEFGVRMVDPDRTGLFTKVNFICEYRYDGLKENENGLFHVIYAQYAMRYKAGDDPSGDPLLNRISGSHIITILISADGNSDIFMRDQVEEQYYYNNDRTTTFSGFCLTWYDEVLSLNKTGIIKEVEIILEDTGIEDIEVTVVPEGISLSIQNIHFIPDSSEILPIERDRLDSIFAILNNIEGRTFLITGHTADIGTKESQYELSVLRAKRIVDELTDRGLRANRFLYEGKGGDIPVAPNNTEIDRAKNRRVEITILED